MRLSDVPRKLVKLSAMAIKDGKARRIFILADGKRSLKAIFGMSNIEPQEGFEVAALMSEDGYIQCSSDSPATALKQSSIKNQQPIPVKDFINGLTAALSEYIGPVASIIINDFDIPEREIGSELRQHIINASSLEIDEEVDKQRFLETVRIAAWS
jgi:hypothetical protein